MQPGLTSDLSNLDDVRKTAVINKELARLKVDIAPLQEMRLANAGCEGTTLHLLLVRTTRAGNRRAWCRICCQKSPPTDDNSCKRRNGKDTHTLSIIRAQGTANILCIYAPTVSASQERKDRFYEDLNTAVKIK